MNSRMTTPAGRGVPLLMQRKPVATLNEYTGKPVMKSAHWAYESAAAAAHELPPDGGTKAALCAAYSAFTGVKVEFANCRFVDDWLLSQCSGLLPCGCVAAVPLLSGFSQLNWLWGCLLAL